MVGHALRAFLVFGLLLLLTHVILVRITSSSLTSSPFSLLPGFKPPGDQAPLHVSAPEPAQAFALVERHAATGAVVASAPTRPKDTCEEQAEFERRILESPDVESFFQSRVTGTGSGECSKEDEACHLGPATLGGRVVFAETATPGADAGFLPGIFDGGDGALSAF